jgi:DNA polymerase elongation subunit (family B)
VGRKKIAESRVISLDMETALFRERDFLTNERILAIAVARRIENKLGGSRGIEVKSWLLKEGSDIGEYKLLEELNEALKPEPLGVVGYGIRDYDLPLLSIKMKRYDPEIEDVKQRIPQAKKLWHVINMLERAIHIDFMTRFRHKLKVKGFDDLLEHPEFSKLPLKKVKHPSPLKSETKGELMYKLWREKPEELKSLVEAHVHDALLIAEFEFFRQKMM